MVQIQSLAEFTKVLVLACKYISNVLPKNRHGSIRVLGKAMGGGFPQKKALRRYIRFNVIRQRYEGVGGCQFSRKKHYVTIELPHVLD